MKVYWDYRDVDGVGPCKVYFLNGIPFTFDEDEVPPVHDKEYLVKPSLTNEDIFKRIILPDGRRIPSSTR